MAAGLENGTTFAKHISHHKLSQHPSMKHGAGSLLSTSIAVLVLLPLALLVLVFFVVFPNEHHLQSLIGLSNPRLAFGNLTGPVYVKPDFRLLIGVLTVPDSYERRNLVRTIYALQQPALENVVVDVKFVVCNLTKEDQRVLVALEIMRFDDIIILNCEENMNRGKTYTYFSSLPGMFAGAGGDSDTAPPYDYVMKADDDIFFRLPRLVESLHRMPRDDLYYGFVIPCESMDPWHEYMSGMGFIMSWDIVEWISTSEMVRNHSFGYAEDMVAGEWLRDGHRGHNRFNMKPAMYDYPIEKPIDACSHDFIPDTIAVHRLKDNHKWARTLNYFNFTGGLKPSKLYHIP